MKKTTNDFTQAELNEFINAASTDYSGGKERTALESVFAPTTGTNASAEIAGEGQVDDSLFLSANEDTSPTLAPASSPVTDTPPTTARRVSNKQRKLSLDEYRVSLFPHLHR